MRRLARRPVITTALWLGAALVGLTACWDIMPIEDLGFANLVYVDRTRTGQVEVQADVLVPAALQSGISSGNPSGGGGGGGGGGAVLKATGQGADTAAALHNAERRSVQRLYTGHIQALLVGEGEARGHMADVLDYFDRNPRSRVIDWLYVVAHRDEAAVRNLTSTSSNADPASSLVTYSYQLEEASDLHPTRVYEVLGLMAGGDQGAAVPTLGVDPIAHSYQATGLALFRGDRWVGTMTLDQSRALPWLLHQVRSQELTLPCPLPGPQNGVVTVQTMGGTRRILPQWTAGRLSGLAVALSSTVRLSEVGGRCALDVAQPRDRDLLETAASAAILRTVTGGLRYARSVGADPFGFGQAVRIASPAEWSRIGADWADRVFPSLPVDVTVHVALDDSGELTGHAVQGAVGGVGPSARQRA